MTTPGSAPAVSSQAHALDDQSEVFALLSDPSTHGLIEPVIRIDTHGAAVFLAGPDVYKVKRAVRFDYMDFSTLARRHAACLAELSVNRDNAPSLYLGVSPIMRGDDGALHIGGPGVVVEWAVHLTRFDETATLDCLAKRGTIDPDLIDALGHAVAVAHGLAPVCHDACATAALRGVVRQTMDELVADSEYFPPARTAALGAMVGAAFDGVEALLLSREAAAQVRRCHGDLHLGNVVVIDGRPVLFDALEFDEALAIGDVLYDLAFLVMDLCVRGTVSDANRLLNGYLGAVADERRQVDGLAAFPIFLALRAAVRAKVAASSARSDPVDTNKRQGAMAYFDAAAEFLEPPAPRLVAIGGLSGTGKTKLARALAPLLGRKPGAIHLRSDVERKRLAHAPITVRLPSETYDQSASASVYDALERLAGRALGTGQVVVADATFQGARQRDAMATVAASAGVPFTGLWLEAPVAVRVRRVEARRGDASDATGAVARAQTVSGVLRWDRLDAGKSFDGLVSDALAVIGPHPSTA